MQQHSTANGRPCGHQYTAYDCLDCEVPATTTLALERLPNGEPAWLRPALCRHDSPAGPHYRNGLCPPDPEVPIPYTVTDRGRRALAMLALFGHD